MQTFYTLQILAFSLPAPYFFPERGKKFEIPDMYLEFFNKVMGKKIRKRRRQAAALQDATDHHGAMRLAMTEEVGGS